MEENECEQSITLFLSFFIMSILK